MVCKCTVYVYMVCVRLNIRQDATSGFPSQCPIKTSVVNTSFSGPMRGKKFLVYCGDSHPLVYVHLSAFGVVRLQTFCRTSTPNG